MCTCMWRPEVNLSYYPSGLTTLFFICLFGLFLRSLLILELSNMAKLADQWALEIYVSHPKHQTYMCIPLGSAFYHGLSNSTRVLVFTGQVVTDSAICPALLWYFLTLLFFFVQKRILFSFICKCVSMCEHAHMHVGAAGVQKISCVLELQAQGLWIAQQTCWKQNSGPLQEWQAPLAYWAISPALRQSYKPPHQPLWIYSHLYISMRPDLKRMDQPLEWTWSVLIDLSPQA